VLELLYYPDPRLYTVAKPIKRIDSNLREIASQMLRVMYAEHGIGLAGPQVGIDRRIIVVNPTGQQEDERVFLNPEILKKARESKQEEGCLSIPEVMVHIMRAEWIVVRAMGLDGTKQTMEVEGVYAKIFQHEIDHLDGILILDKMSPAERLQYAPVLRKLRDTYRSARRKKAPSVGKP
jgi:peptide deformylase